MHVCFVVAVSNQLSSMGSTSLQMPVIAANRVGKEEFPERREKTASSITFHGGSFITGPTGEIVAQVPRIKHELAFDTVTGPSLRGTHLDALPMFT